MATKTINTKLLDTMKWRCIGPPRGGRVIAVAGHPTEKMVFYLMRVSVMKEPTMKKKVKMKISHINLLMIFYQLS